jgi:hypothetical protein
MNYRKITSKEYCEALVLFLICLILNLINLISSISTFSNSWIAVMNGITLAMINFFTFVSYLGLEDRPVVTVLSIVLAQLSSFVNGLLNGYTVTATITNLGVVSILSIIALIVNIKVVSNKLKDIENKKDKVKATVMFNRRTLRVKWYYKLIIWCIIVTSVMSLANSDMLSTLGNDIGIKVYGSLAVLIPTFLIIGILTTSDIAYDIINVYTLLELYTIYSLIMIGELTVITALYMILEVIIVVLINIRRYKRKTKVDKEK